jgi:elongation factor G
VDFTVEVERSLRVLDSAVATFCAVGRVQPQSETVWRQADKYKIPRLAFVNKMDRVGADFFAVIEEIHERLGANAIPICLPIGSEESFRGIVDLLSMKAYIYDSASKDLINFTVEEVPSSMQEEVEEWRGKLIEAAAEFDDALMEKYFEDSSSITSEEVTGALRKATLALKIVPVTCGTSLKNKGIQFLLDAICKYLPSPMDIEPVVGVNPYTQKNEKRAPSAEEPFCGLVFKIATDPFVGRLAYIRAYSGKIETGKTVLNVRTGKRERINRLYQMHSNKQNPIEYLEAGDIGSGIGFKDLRTGDTICVDKHPIVLEAITFPDPVIGLAVEPKTQKDLDKLGVALSKLAEEDPTFTVRTDVETGQTVISGMGELHLEIIVDRLKREFGVEINQGAPQVNYRETIQGTVSHREVFKKQTGGRGKFADIVFTLEPADPGVTGLQFVDKVKGGNIPREYIPSVEKGFKAAMENGVLAGYPVTGMKVTLTDGSYHAVDSDSLSFEICARMAFRKAAPKAGPVLLEPIMSMEVVTPEDYMGDIIGDLNKRRGQVTNMDSKGNARIIKAKVPLAELFGYITTLRTLSSGRATSSMEFCDYDELPSSLAKEVIEKTGWAKGFHASDVEF